MKKSSATLFSCAKNEGPFLLEWVAYHRMIGFDRIILFTNDNTDGSDPLLAVLHDRGLIEHYAHSPDTAPQKAAVAKAMDMGLFRDGDWMMWIDLDEFLNIHIDDGHLSDLLAHMDENSGMIINWRMFGAAGNETWPGRQISPDFAKASARAFYTNAQVKSLFRWGDHIVDLDVHRPIFKNTDFVSQIGPYVNGRFRNVVDEFYMGKRRNGAPIHKSNNTPQFFERAQINHYVVRTPDMYARRKNRGRGLTASDGQVNERHTDEYYDTMNRNTWEDASILRHYDALTAEIDRLLQDPDIAAAQIIACT